MKLKKYCGISAASSTVAFNGNAISAQNNNNNNGESKYRNYSQTGGHQSHSNDANHSQAMVDSDGNIVIHLGGDSQPIKIECDSETV